MNVIKKNLALVLAMALMLCLFYFCASMLKASIGSVAIILHKKYNINELELSMISSVFYLVAGVLKIPMGILIDKYGAKKILLSVIVFTSIGSILFANSNSFSGFLIARTLMALSYASAFLCTVKVISQYFHPRLYALLIGIILSLGYLGASFAGGPLSDITIKFGIHDTYFAIAIIGMILFLLLAIQLDNNNSSSNNESLVSHIKSSIRLFKNKQVVYITLYCGLIVAAPICIADLWGKLYLVNIYGIDSNFAGYISTTLIYLGIALGSLIWGILHSIFIFDTKTLKTVSTFMFILLIVFFVAPISSPIIVAIVAFMIGALAAVKVVCYELAKRYVTYDNLAVVVAFMAMSVTFSSFVLVSLVGFIKRLSEYFISDNILISYTTAVAILPIIAIITIILASKIIPIENKQKVTA